MPQFINRIPAESVQHPWPPLSTIEEVHNTRSGQSEYRPFRPEFYDEDRSGVMMRAWRGVLLGRTDPNSGNAYYYHTYEEALHDLWGAYAQDAEWREMAEQVGPQAKNYGVTRRPGRPRIHQEPRQDVRVSLPVDLITAIDAAAHNRTAFIERAIRAALTREAETEGGG